MKENEFLELVSFYKVWLRILVVFFYFNLNIEWFKRFYFIIFVFVLFFYLFYDDFSFKFCQWVEWYQEWVVFYNFGQVFSYFFYYVFLSVVEVEELVVGYYFVDLVEFLVFEQVYWNECQWSYGEVCFVVEFFLSFFFIVIISWVVIILLLLVLLGNFRIVVYVGNQQFLLRMYVLLRRIQGYFLGENGFILLFMYFLMSFGEVVLKLI